MQAQGCARRQDAEVWKDTRMLGILRVSGGHNFAAFYRPANETASPPWRLIHRSRTSGSGGGCVNPCFLPQRP